MDEVIFEEFKGTGNMELVLDRKIADRRVYPAVDIFKSGTRKEDLLLDPKNLNKIWVLAQVPVRLQPDRGHGVPDRQARARPRTTSSSWGR